MREKRRMPSQQLLSSREGAVQPGNGEMIISDIVTAVRPAQGFWKGQSGKCPVFRSPLSLGEPSPLQEAHRFDTDGACEPSCGGGSTPSGEGRQIAAPGCRGSPQAPLEEIVPLV